MPRAAYCAEQQRARGADARSERRPRSEIDDGDSRLLTMEGTVAGMETEDDAAAPMTLCAKVCGVRELAMAILEHLACPSLGQLAGACRDLRALANEDSLWAALAERRWRLASVQRRATRPRGPAAARFDDCASTAAATFAPLTVLHGARSWRQTYRQLRAAADAAHAVDQRHHALFARGRGAGVDCFVCVNHTADCRTPAAAAARAAGGASAGAGASASASARRARESAAIELRVLLQNVAHGAVRFRRRDAAARGRRPGVEPTAAAP